MKKQFTIQDNLEYSCYGAVLEKCRDLTPSESEIVNHFADISKSKLKKMIIIYSISIPATIILVYFEPLLSNLSGISSSTYENISVATFCISISSIIFVNDWLLHRKNIITDSIYSKALIFKYRKKPNFMFKLSIEEKEEMSFTKYFKVLRRHTGKPEIYYHDPAIEDTEEEVVILPFSRLRLDWLNLKSKVEYEPKHIIYTAGKVETGKTYRYNKNSNSETNFRRALYERDLSHNEKLELKKIINTFKYPSEDALFSLSDTFFKYFPKKIAEKTVLALAFNNKNLTDGTVPEDDIVEVLPDSLRLWRIGKIPGDFRHTPHKSKEFLK